MSNFPRGTVTFLFTDIEGSTRLWERRPGAMRQAVVRHLALLDAAITAHHGVHFKTVGDAVRAAFPVASDALAAAIAAQQALLAEPWPEEIGDLSVRMALHTGAAEPVAGDYLAPALNRLSRLLDTGHGGQILVSAVVQRLIADDLPPDVRLLSLGRHALRDLHEPEAVFQVVAPGLPERVPDLRSVPHHPTNLVVPPTPLIGREHELATVMRQVRDEGARLITLTGPGGSGKTRLAQEIGTALRDTFPDGVYFVDLASLRDPELVLPTVAAVLRVRARPTETLRESLIAYLAPKAMLLVLDNCEQVIDAASDIAAVLDACPHLVMIATSREPLRIRFEREYPVAPLALPAVGQATLVDLVQIPAVALFVARARARNPRFALTEENAPVVAEICRRLDGLPLAIELAAARVSHLSPRTLLDRLNVPGSGRLPFLTGGPRDLPSRQQTMRDTIAWSHDLLVEPEQELFASLAVFPSGFTLEAAEYVSSPSVLDLLDSLVAKSLVLFEDNQDEDPRYRMLETIREFGRERLVASGREATVQQRHAAWALVLAERAGPNVRGPEAAVWLEALERDHASLRAALAWLEERRDKEGLVRLAGVLWPFWKEHAHYAEGLHWLEVALDLGREAPAPDRLRLLTGAGTLAWYQADEVSSRQLHEQALVLAQEIGDRVAEAFACSKSPSSEA
jgi:predicted ATPase/class 3 adenylate cyclase